MKGSDLFYFETSVRDEVTDAHVLDVLYPVPDDCQDWELIDSRQDEGFLMVQTRRLLNTGDPQDRRIVDDSSSDIPGHRIIAAWGDTSSISYHVGRRARGMVRWYRFGHNDGVSFDKLISEQSDGYFELTAQDYPIKPIDTEYVSFCLTWSEVRAQLPPDLDSFMVIGVEELIDEDTAPYIHHFTAFGGGEEDVSECTERGSMLDLIYAWAPGENAMMTPENVGISFGGEDGHKSLRLEIHYNNPKFVDGELDSSGIRLFYTTTPRQYELGGMQLGDPVLSLLGEPVGQGLTQHTFDCPSSCSSLALSEPVTVTVESLHMHQTGVSMRNELIRNGKVVHVGQVDYFDFDQQGSFLVQQKSFQVLPGDAWRTTCTYRATNDTVFGYSSQEEMCMGFFFYYPRMTIRGRAPWICSRELPVIRSCQASYSARTLESEDKLDRAFGPPAEECRDASLGSVPTAPPSDAAVEETDECFETDSCDGFLGKGYWMHKDTNRLGRAQNRCTDQCFWPSLTKRLQDRGYTCGPCK